MIDCMTALLLIVCVIGLVAIGAFFYAKHLFLNR